MKRLWDWYVDAIESSFYFFGHVLLILLGINAWFDMFGHGLDINADAIILSISMIIAGKLRELSNPERNN